MSADTNQRPQEIAVRDHILSLLNDLPPESLSVVERFVEFIHEQARRGQSVMSKSVKEEKPPYLFPSVSIPASSLDALTDLLPEGYEGDALADTEALYDKAQ